MTEIHKKGHKVPRSAKKPDQARAFRKAARELGCDSDEVRFQDALRKVAKHKPKEAPEGKKND